MKVIASLGAALLAGVIACGGAEKTPAEPAPDDGGDDAAEVTDTGDQMIPAEKFDEINRTFERKQTQVSRCFVAGVDAGEVQKTDRGMVTVTTTITPAGKATNVRIVENTFKSPALESCVKDLVSRWLFTTLPRNLDYSYQYRLERF